MMKDTRSCKSNGHQDAGEQQGYYKGWLPRWLCVSTFCLFTPAKFQTDSVTIDIPAKFKHSQNGGLTYQYNSWEVSYLSVIFEPWADRRGMSWKTQIGADSH